MKISIIGIGIYSIALALNIPSNYKITMWTENIELEKQFKKNHQLIPITDVLIPSNIKVTSNIKKALNNPDLIIIGTSAKYVRNVCTSIKEYFNPLTPVCIASKGIENGTCSFLSDIVKTVLKAKHLAVISGPTFAIDLINKEPCSLSIASTSKKALKYVNMALASNNLKLRANKDLYGTEICGSIKNVIAIAAGILDGLGYKESTRAFLITESLHDIKELLGKLDCNPKTILSFAGIGDLILTANSPKSRNFSFGVLLGKKASIRQINNYLKKNTTEGYYTLLSIKALTKNKKIKIPIINIIYDIAVNNKEPEILVDFLINKQ